MWRGGEGPGCDDGGQVGRMTGVVTQLLGRECSSGQVVTLAICWDSRKGRGWEPG